MKIKIKHVLVIQAMQPYLPCKPCIHAKKKKDLNGHRVPKWA